MKPIRLLHLYPDRMNIYGDYGNIIALQQRMDWRSIEFDYIPHFTGDKLKGEYDLIFMGGGQDKGQVFAAQDLLHHKSLLHDHFRRNVPILTICGGYQLFGNYFITSTGEEIPGIEIFNVVTKATNTRMIGNIVVDSPIFGDLIGFENHSGNTELLEGVNPLGTVKKGYGNNNHDKLEGVFINNAIGTYLHGSFLPKNPLVADYLIQKAVALQSPAYQLTELDNWLENSAAKSAMKR